MIEHAKDVYPSLTSAAVMLVRSMPEIVNAVDDGLLGEGPGPKDGPWVFQGTLGNNEPFQNPVNTSMCAIVISAWNVWNYSDFHSNNFPLLQVSIYADPTRATGTSDISKYDAHTKALKLYNIIDPVFHDVANRQHDWFGVPIFSSTRYSGPSIGDVPDNGGMVILTVRYSVSTY